MKTSLQMKLLAVALLGAYGLAQADTSTVLDIYNHLTVQNDPSYQFEDDSSTKLDNDLKVDVDVRFEEVFDPVKGAVATAYDTQKILNTTINVPDPSHTTLLGSVNYNSGNVGVNAASGIGNQQANDAALAVNMSSSYGPGMVSTAMNNNDDDHDDHDDDDGPYMRHEKATAASTGFEQMVSYNSVTIGNPFHWDTQEAKAKVEDSVWGNLGNTGVNAAAGLGNQQKNDLAIAYDAGRADVVWAKSGGVQLSLDNDFLINSTWIPLVSRASLINSVHGNTGNTGVNVAAGLFNQQANGLALAVADSSHLAMAAAGGMQVMSGNYSSTYLPLVNHSTISGSVSNNTGNIGVNVASGINNQQSNTMAIAAHY